MESGPDVLLFGIVVKKESPYKTKLCKGLGGVGPSVSSGLRWVNAEGLSRTSSSSLLRDLTLSARFAVKPPTGILIRSFQTLRSHRMVAEGHGVFFQKTPKQKATIWWPFVVGAEGFEPPTSAL